MTYSSLSVDDTMLHLYVLWLILHVEEAFGFMASDSGRGVGRYGPESLEC